MEQQTSVILYDSSSKEKLKIGDERANSFNNVIDNGETIIAFANSKRPSYND